MWLPKVVLVLFLSVRCDTDHVHELYKDFADEVINVKALSRAIRDSAPDLSDDNVLAMVDASAKVPEGIMAGKLFHLGHFDECYSIHNGDVYGKYCLGTLSLSDQTKKYFDGFKINMTVRRIHPLLDAGSAGLSGLPSIRMGTCVPSNMALADIPGLLDYQEEFCYSKATDPPLSDGAIATIVLLAVFIAIAVVSTLFDIYLYYTKKEAPHELLIAFSFLTNGRKLVTSTSNPDQLLCLNGIRAISMMWVILGHEYSTSFNAPLYNFVDVQTWQHDSANMLINGAEVAVDTFFLIAGLVTVYTFLRSMKKGVRFNLILFYVHRYIRLTPALGVMILVHMYLVQHVANGPMWKFLDWSLIDSCERAWWSVILYITNYVKKGFCLTQAWFLAVDMQLFVLSPLLMIPLNRWPKPTLGVLGLLYIAGCIIPFTLAYTKRWGPGMNNADAEFVNYYTQTYTRFAPYVAGMILGYFIYKIKQKELTIKIPKLAACGLWLVCLTGMVTCVYAFFPLTIATDEDRWANAAFTGLNRPAWALFLAGVIFLCVAGYGDPVDKFLSFPLFQFMAKVSYSIYLVHFAVINIKYAAMKNTIKFSNSAYFYTFWADFMVTLWFAILLCLTFESPIIILEKYIFGNIGSPKKVRKGTDESKSKA